MRNVRSLSLLLRGASCGIVLLGWFAASLTTAHAQTLCPGTPNQGFNDIYGNCTGTAVQQGTYSFIDARQFIPATGAKDICVTIDNIFTNSYYPSVVNVNGIVIDARDSRSFTVTSGSLSCSKNPWASAGTGASAADFPNIVLLPAGTITLSSGAKWTLPASTRVVGAGANLTLIQAATGFTGDMIDMGSLGSSGVCTNNDCQAVIIEHLRLDGGSPTTNTVNAIVNVSSQELSRVNDVQITGITGSGVGLTLSGTYANNSGPYTNISFSGSGICVNVNSTTTRGIHGLTCNTTGSSNSAAIYLDGQSNSLEDVSVTGPSTQDGILIGSSAVSGSLSSSNVLFNITGNGLKNIIEISNANVANLTSPSDLTILGVTNSGSTTTIQDDLVGSTLNDPNLGLYILGEPVIRNGSAGPKTIGYSRYTTSTNTNSGANSAAWIVGGASTPANPCATGSLYSRTSGTTGNTLWECANDSWSVVF